MQALNIGAGKSNPACRRIGLKTGAVAELADVLTLRKPAHESWWTFHQYEGNKRSKANWRSSDGCAIDVDYHDRAGKHASIPETIAAQIEDMADGGDLPGNLLHLTPRGFRIVFCWQETVTDMGLQVRASNGCAAVLGKYLHGTGLHGIEIDTTVTADLARMVYAPNANICGHQREADVIVLCGEKVDAKDIAKQAPQDKQKAQEQREERTRASAIDKYNARYAQDWGQPGQGQCPVCGHDKCFGALPAEPSKWCCFSANHEQDGGAVGIQAGSCWTGDALDLACHETGRTQREMLTYCGLLDGRQATVTDIQARHSKTHGHLVKVYRSSIGDKLFDGKIGYNQMLQSVTVDGDRLSPGWIGAVRERTEDTLIGGNGEPLCIGEDKLQAVVQQVAHERPYHPVRQWLRKLPAWDGTSRIYRVPAEVLHTTTERDLASEYMLRWFIGAVARPLQPGCKHDTVLVIQGGQGMGKSTALKILAGDDWFCDSPIDIGNKDGFLVLSRHWIIEWAELEAMQRARDPNSVKSFISSSTDTYRPPYGREVLDIPRTCVIVGTTNETDFLTDTQNRRYWVIGTGKSLDLELLAKWRVQLWAEALHLYDAGERWWLDSYTDTLRESDLQQYKKENTWTEPVRQYIKDRRAAGSEEDIKLGEVLRNAIGIEPAQQTRTHILRAAEVLRDLGYSRQTDSTGRKVWRR